MALIEDQFNRSDSGSVGGDWTEVDSAGVLGIVSNKMRHSQNASQTNPYIYQSLSQQNVLKITGVFQIGSGLSDIDTYFGWYVRNNGGNPASDGYGVQFHDCRTSGNTYFSVVDDGSVKSNTQTFGLITKGVDYNFEILINSDNHIEFRLWLSSGSRPATATLEWTNGGSAYTPTASGSNFAYGGLDGSSSSSYSYLIDSDWILVEDNTPSADTGNFFQLF